MNYRGNKKFLLPEDKFVLTLTRDGVARATIDVTREELENVHDPWDLISQHLDILLEKTYHQVNNPGWRGER